MRSSYTPAVTSTPTVTPLQQSATSESARSLRGIAAMLVGVGLFSIMDSLVKYLGATYHPLEIVFFRGAVAFVPIMAVVMARGGLGVLRTRKPGAHALRCLIGIGPTILVLIALAGLPPATANSIRLPLPLVPTPAPAPAPA